VRTVVHFRIWLCKICTDETRQDALQEFLHDTGIPSQIHTDGAKDSLKELGDKSVGTLI